MMPKLAAILFCDAAATAPDGKFTLYGIFDVIGCHKAPVRHPQFSIFWKLYSNQLGKISVRIEKPDGSPLMTGPSLDLRENPFGIHQGVFTLGGVEFPILGDYRAVLLLNDTTEIGSATIKLNKSNG